MTHNTLVQRGQIRLLAPRPTTQADRSITVLRW